MFIRQKFRVKDGKRHAYWALVESCRTERGPRQRIVSWLGKLDEHGRLAIERAADDAKRHWRDRQPNGCVQLSLLDDQPPEWVKVDAQGVRVENCKQFGGPWLAFKLIERLQLDGFFSRVMANGREAVPWATTAMLLVIARLCDPSSELYIAEQWYHKTALPQLLGVPPLGGLCDQAGLGSEPRRVLTELSEIRSMDVVLPTDKGVELRCSCVSRPSEHQAILRKRLGLRLPSRLRQMEM